MTHYPDIPNWQLFQLKFEPTPEFVTHVESRFDVLKNTPEYETVAKQINVQIGILNLREREMGQEAMREFAQIFQN